MSSRLCTVCKTIFTGTQYLRQERPHHQLREHVQEAADRGCYICDIIQRSEGWQSMNPLDPFKSVWRLTKVVDLPDWMKLTIDAAWDENDEDESNSLSTSEAETLNKVPSQTDISVSQIPENDFVLPAPPMWSFVLQPASDVESNIGHWVPPPDFKSPGLLDLAHQWFSTCVTDHSSCSKLESSFLPTRLLEIITDDFLRVIVSREQPTFGPYATLSHCWGKTMHLKLLQSNIGQLRSMIRAEELPTSYREAIGICRRFQFRYIWIDSLCIIQDSREDWLREAFVMKDVYQNSVMNIAAAGAAESSESSFASRKLSVLRPLPLQAEWEGQGRENYYLTDGHIYENQVMQSPLFRRAWVLQELWLAPRILFLTKSQLWWDCRHFTACEAYPHGVPLPWLSRSPNSISGPLGMYDRWNRLVEDYSECYLTFLSDKMIAYSGIAQRFQESWPSDMYVAGLWRSQLPAALHWQTSHIRPSHRPSIYRAPSWSWVSIEGPIYFGYSLKLASERRMEVSCVLLDVATYPVDYNDKGDLRGGNIRIKGRLTRVGWRDNCISVEDSDGSWDYIKGTDEECANISKGETWTTFMFDECTPEGDPMISYIDGLTPQACVSGQMDGTTRRTIHTAALIGSLFALSIIEWQAEGKSHCGGIVLCQTQTWPDHIYQRVGSFTAVGEIATKELHDRGVVKNIMIL